MTKEHIERLIASFVQQKDHLSDIADISIKMSADDPEDRLKFEAARDMNLIASTAGLVMAGLADAFKAAITE